jgi:hypothetical protein
MGMRVGKLRQTAVLFAISAVSVVTIGGAEVRALPDGAARLEAPSLFAVGAPDRAPETGRLAASRLRAFEDELWWGGAYTTSTGERVTVFFWIEYPVDHAAASRWAEFFAGLVHGKELGSLRAYVAPQVEVAAICGSPSALGCYGESKLFTIGETAYGFAPSTIAAHEYGHHVAANRVNAPWLALDWGTKRWASGEGICTRAAAGTVFPGNESFLYRLNPGEGFAEAYRVLNEKRAGAVGFDWPLVDSRFIPDDAALQRIEQDVLQPWSAPTSRTFPAHFSVRQGRTRTWSLPVATPLDGDLTVKLQVPARGYRLTLLSSDRGSVLASGRSAGRGTKTLRYRVCGRRSVVVRVSGAGAPRAFSVQVSVP